MSQFYLKLQKKSKTAKMADHFIQICVKNGPITNFGAQQVFRQKR